MKLLILATLVCIAAANVDVEIKSHWNGGFNGKFCIDIAKELHTWKAHVIFDKPVESIEVWVAELSETLQDGKEFVFTNKVWNADEHVGDQLCIEFVGHTTGDINPTGSAFIEGMDSHGNKVTGAATQGATMPPDYTGTTTAPPTAAPTHKVTYPANLNGSIPGTLKIYNDWGNRFEAEFSFPLTENVEGWMVAITFDSPVVKMDMWNADKYSTSDGGRKWVIVSKPDREFFKAGDAAKVRFFANYGSGTGGKAPSAIGLFTNLGIDKRAVPSLPNHDCTKYNYDDVLYKSILFYETQRSGKLPASNRIPWRGDSGLKDGSDAGIDLTGGWYDAGDHVKFGFPMAYSTAILAWSLLEFKDAYQKSGQLEHMYDSIKWPLDYFLKAHTGKTELYVQVGDASTDHSYWGRPEDLPMARPSYKITASNPGTDVAGATSVAFIAGYYAFKEKDPAYAAKLLTHGKELYDFAMTHKGRYTDSVSAAAGYYKSTNMTDEMCWSSLWMYKVTNESKYLAEAEKWFQPEPAWGMSWDDVQAANQVLLYKFTKKDIYKQAVEGTFKYWMPGGTIKYTPKGLAWRLQWGSLRYASNMALVALLAAEEGLNAVEYRKWAMSQIHYALGDTGFSFLIGYGKNFPHSPHHRAASCPNPPAPCGPFIMSTKEPNVHTLYGALVGGPDSDGSYQDSRQNYINNEVATDYNAGFQAAVAGLKSLVIRKLHPEQSGGTTCSK
ncbi:endoglucanase A-like [Patella vulgata]|uniref:endoglucanase A-like n=1 Tax=Patella vulgata TaxID=6465 RepID=UPI0024A8FC28|nr:endoglucanase A-like [Patella vulgata]